MARPLYSYQAATALYLGQRDNQEDAIATSFAIGEDLGFAVLSDGMGGHNAGDIASKVVVTEVFSELKLHSGNPGAFRGRVQEILQGAAEIANARVGDIARGAPEAHGMGATLTVPVLLRDELFWLSVGDSPLYLHRSGHLRQLNEDHSMAPHIDLMVRTGLLSEIGGRDHPDRNCLTSVLVGSPISKIDCPDTPTQLFDGDIVVAASDGLQTLSHVQIRDIITRHANDSSDRIAEELLHEIEHRNDPDQDNVSLIVIKVCHTVAKQHAQVKPDDGIIELAEAEKARAKRGRRRLPKLRQGLARLLPVAPGAAD
ncbi:MAG: protein phosphatase 2C domain-containing protein [Pseudomonadota bacterium]